MLFIASHDYLVNREEDAPCNIKRNIFTIIAVQNFALYDLMLYLLYYYSIL